MAKIFTNKDFCDKLRHITTLSTIYYSGGSEWSTWNGWAWQFDCVVSVKSVLWGWCENTKAPHGGAIYASNGVPDFTCNGGLDYCTEVSTNFSNLTPGEYLCMKGTQYDHVGVYLGDGKVFEVSTAWGVNGATISSIDTEGNRSKDGVWCLKWTYHGKLKWIDYNYTPTPTDKVNVYYKVKTIEDGWLPEVKNLEDYAGLGSHKIIDIAIKVDKGSVWYQVHNKGGSWLPTVSGYDTSDFNNGYAGNDNEIDCVRIYYNTPEEIIKKEGYKKAKYRINGLPWQYDDEITSDQDGYAGIYGKNAYRLEITIE